MHARKRITNEQRQLLRQCQRYRGLFTRIARQLGRDRTHVSRVAMGERKSKMIERALRAELDRLNREAA